MTRRTPACAAAGLASAAAGFRALSRRFGTADAASRAPPPSRVAPVARPAARWRRHSPPRPLARRPRRLAPPDGVEAPPLPLGASRRVGASRATATTFRASPRVVASRRARSPRGPRASRDDHDANAADDAAAASSSSSSSSSPTPSTTTTSSSSSSLPGYPPGTSRLALMFDPHSRLSMPSPSGAPEVQKRPTSDIFWGALMCFLATLALSLVDRYASSMHGLPFLTGSWGTLSVLAFGTVDNPAARPWNRAVATVLASIVAAALVATVGTGPVARAAGVAIALACMMQFGAIHPPGAAAVYFAMDNAAEVARLGAVYAVYPTLVGSLFVLAMGRLTVWLKTRFEFTL